MAPERSNGIDIRQLIRVIGSLPDYEVPDAAERMILRTFALPFLTWDRRATGEALGGQLPMQLLQLWDEAAGLVLFWDVTYGQWGLVVWSPEQAVLRQAMFRERRETQFRPGDVLIGEFLGDSDLLLLRCDPASPDYGAVMVVLPIDPRDRWPTAGTSLGAFFSALVDAHGAKFWEHGG